MNTPFCVYFSLSRIHDWISCPHDDCWYKHEIPPLFCLESFGLNTLKNIKLNNQKNKIINEYSIRRNDYPKLHDVFEDWSYDKRLNINNKIEQILTGVKYDYINLNFPYHFNNEEIENIMKEQSDIWFSLKMIHLDYITIIKRFNGKIFILPFCFICFLNREECNHAILINNNKKYKCYKKNNIDFLFRKVRFLKNKTNVDLFHKNYNDTFMIRTTLNYLVLRLMHYLQYNIEKYFLNNYYNKYQNVVDILHQLNNLLKHGNFHYLKLVFTIISYIFKVNVFKFKDPTEGSIYEVITNYDGRRDLLLLTKLIYINRDDINKKIKENNLKLDLEFLRFYKYNDDDDFLIMEFLNKIKIYAENDSLDYNHIEFDYNLNYFDFKANKFKNDNEKLSITINNNNL